MANSQFKHDPNQVFSFILKFKASNDGISPTIRQICEACGISSTSVVAKILKRLEQRGWITLEPRFQTRNIKVVGGHWQPPNSTS
jgi:SOS-response transcriptional repressor LexA